MEENICGISTSLGNGAISIIRVSGNDALLIVSKIFTKNLIKENSHTIHYGYIKNEEELIDEVLVSIMKSPKTYTKEDMVEINAHGGEATTFKILELLLEKGCRLAEPGEFTKRAFLNGRIDLTKSEAVNDLINAKTEAARKMAISSVSGKLYEKINSLREKLVQIITNIEVNIDYPEYKDEVQVTNELIDKFLSEINKELDLIIQESKEGQIIKQGINVAIVGKPNVGKSSLLNILIDEEKAIVTSVAGTTRDIVEGSITLNGVQVNFIDTAGIRDTSDIVEKIGVKKSYEVINNSDLVVMVLNNNETLTKEDQKIIGELDETKTIYFVNKDDLKNKLVLKNKDFISGNTLTLDGIKKLKNKIIDKFNLDKILNKDLTFLTNHRQIDLIKKAKEEINYAIKSKREGLEIDLVEINLKKAWQFLGEITGEYYTDELVDKLFENFCLGK